MSPVKQQATGRDRLVRLLSIVFRTAIVVAGVIYVFYDVDVSSVLSLLTSFHAGDILLLIMIGCLQYLFQGWRLHVLSEGVIRLRHGVAASLVCVGLNLLLPAKIGEVAKIAVIKGTSEVSLEAGLRIVFWERFLDMNMLSILCMALPFMVTETGTYVVIPVGLTLLLWGGCWLLYRWREVLCRWTERIPFAWVGKVMAFLVTSLGTLPSWAAVFRGGVLTVVVWGCMFLLDATAVAHVAGLPLTIGQLGVVFVVSVVGYSIPSSPGAIGIFDAAMVLGLGWFGVDKSQGLAVALLLRMVHYLPSISFTFIYMLANNMGLRDIRQTLNGNA